MSVEALAPRVWMKSWNLAVTNVTVLINQQSIENLYPVPSWTLPIIFLCEFMNHKADIRVTFLPRNKHRSVATHLWFLFLSGGTHEPLAVFHGIQGTRWSLVPGTCLFSCASPCHPLTPWSLKQGERTQVGREPRGPCF